MDTSFYYGKTVIDEKVFTKIIEDTKETVLCSIAKYLYPRFSHAIDDVAQEVYLRAYKSINNGRLRIFKSMKAWLFTIAMNESKRMNKRLIREEQKREKLVSQHQVNLDGHSDAANHHHSVLDAIPLLPGKFISVMHLHISGFNEGEIAEKLAIPVGTVKSRLSRGKKTLAKILNEGANL